ncbi:MAG: aldose epimerase family protein [Lachnospiraceae bacterium]
MGITVSDFGKTESGEEASLYVLKNDAGMTAVVSDLGAVLVSLFVPDRDSEMRDVVLGFDDVESYEKKNGTYYGATIGRCANRIAKGRFTLNGADYQLDVNDGNNNLHGGFSGYETRMWAVSKSENTSEPSITFALSSVHMDQGFPGNADITVTYQVTADQKLRISYQCAADEDTVFNMTNHSYFNLNGHQSGTVLDQEVQIIADSFTMADKESIPTGEIVDVTGTPMDFREFHSIGERIEQPYPALLYGSGYDHNYCVNDSGSSKIVARMRSRKSGILMEVVTDLPGLQLYTGNFITGDQTGKNGMVYPRRSGCCFETQYYPDAVHHSQFAQPVFKAGELYETETVYRFTIFEN